MCLRYESRAADAAGEDGNCVPRMFVQHVFLCLYFAQVLLSIVWMEDVNMRVQEFI